MPINDTTNYWIARGQQMFGPYTGSQVRDYVASGNIVGSDMIRGEQDPEWVLVSVALGTIGTPSPLPPPGGYGEPMPYPTAPANDPGRTMALWSVGVSLFGLFCCSCAPVIGIVLGAVALSKAKPDSRGLAWAGLIIGIVALLVNAAFTIVMMLYPELNPFNDFMKNFPR